MPRPVHGQAGGAVPRGGHRPGPPLPCRTSGNVVRTVPLRKFFTLHVSLTAGLGFLGKGGQAGGQTRPPSRGEGLQLLGENWCPLGRGELHPPTPLGPEFLRESWQPYPGRRGELGGYTRGAGRECRHGRGDSCLQLHRPDRAQPLL